MQKLAEICIRRPVFAAMIVLSLVVVGSASYFKLGVDRFPSVDLPTVSVRTNLPGASPEEVETTVSQRIEEVVNTVEGIDQLPARVLRLSLPPSISTATSIPPPRTFAIVSAPSCVIFRQMYGHRLFPS